MVKLETANLDYRIEEPRLKNHCRKKRNSAHIHIKLRARRKEIKVPILDWEIVEIGSLPLLNQKYDFIRCQKVFASNKSSFYRGFCPKEDPRVTLPSLLLRWVTFLGDRQRSNLYLGKNTIRRWQVFILEISERLIFGWIMVSNSWRHWSAKRVRSCWSNQRWSQRCHFDWSCS